MKVLALTKYGMRAASARQRFGLYAPSFAEAGIDLSFSPLLSDAHIANLSSGKRSLAEVARGYLKRAVTLATSARRADALWVHCETFPYLPGSFERTVHRLGKPVVFDYDDAIFHMYDRSRSGIVRTLLGSKLRPIIAGSAAVTAGNQYLADYAGRWNGRVMVVPTVVDTNDLRPTSARNPKVPVIGWMGSPSTWPYVRPLLALLTDLVGAGRAKVLVVGAGHAAKGDAGGGIEYRDWTEEREFADLQEMDIGIMPVPDLPWERGKSGYKLVQYMAVGIPSIASPVGVNAAMLDGGSAGLLASSPDEWRHAFERLLGDSTMRRSMGEAARALAVENYSLASQAPRLIELFRSL